MIYLFNKIRLFILKNIYQNYNMGIFGLDKLSFVVGLGITLLLCGLIMFYVKQKFAVYDRTIMEQSQLLKHLVTSIQMNSVIGSASAPGAVDSARRAHTLFGGEERNDSRIIVSDDEDEDDDNSNESYSSDTESESDSESSDSDSESENEENPNNSHKPFNINITQLDNEKLNIKQINLSNDIKVVNVDDLRVANETLDNLTTELLSHISVNRESNEDELNVLNTEELKLDETDELMENKLSSSDNLENLLEKKKYVDLSKTQLQELCKERNLSIKGSKKDLIDRLME
jgi:hypothetical protein